MSKLLTKEKRLSEEIARIYIAEILLALEYLHSRGIIYRDLKPDNIIIDADGHLKLTDFGLSKENVDADYNSRSFVGSYAYAAPEVIKRKPHGKTLDWYGLGVLLYEFLIGIPPYYDRD
jgi:serine/threonine protein kinase